MRPQRDHSATPDEETPDLPEEATTVIWAGEGDGFRVTNPLQWDRDVWPEGLDLSPVPARTQGTQPPTVVIDPGAEFPLPVARDLWGDWHDRMIALDESHTRVDNPEKDRRDLSPTALERWRIQNGETEQGP